MSKEKETTTMCARPLFALTLGALVLLPIAVAQDTQGKAPETEPTHFKLVYRLLQIAEDGKIANARSYSTIIGTTGTEAPSAIRCEDRVPIVTGHYGNGGDTNSNLVNTQYQYQDVGTHIDTREPRLFSRQLNLRVSAALCRSVVCVP
jgi:hypothetical protein